MFLWCEALRKRIPKQLINARSQKARGVSIIIFNCRHQREQRSPPNSDCNHFAFRFCANRHLCRQRLRIVGFGEQSKYVFGIELT